MDLMSLINLMSKDVTKMTFAQKCEGGLAVTLLSMLIVFCVLIILMTIIKIMEKILVQKPVVQDNAPKFGVDRQVASPTNIENVPKDESEVVAAIFAAITAGYSSSGSKIVVKNIVRTSDATTVWTRSGRTEQLNS